MKPIVAAVIAGAVGAAGFFGGMTYQKSKQPVLTRAGLVQMRDRMGSGNTANPPANPMRAGFSGGMTSGEVINTDGQSLTVKTPDGSSKIIILSANTKYTKSAEATSTEVSVGTTVMITGTANTDGSITATSIQLNPAFRNQPQPTID